MVVPSFLGKCLEMSLSATKSTANKKMWSLLSSATDVLPIRGKYKLWIYRNYIGDRKQGKKKYQELQSEFDCLGIPCIYDTVEF